MKIYLAHASSMNYQTELYAPIRSDSFFASHEIVLPHEASSDISNTRADYQKYDLVIAECSQASTGLGIELGWFYDERKPIYCFYQAGAKPSGALRAVTQRISAYQDTEDLIQQIKVILKNLS